MINKKILKRVLLSIFTLLTIGLIILSYLNRPIGKEEAMEKIQRDLEKYVMSNDDVSGAIFSIHSDSQHLSETLYTDDYVSKNHPFYVASVGKTFTAVLIGQLADKGKLQYNDPIAKYLPKTTLDGLFVYEGIDYQNQVTIEQLLGHTSGVNDYFEGPVTSGQSMKELLIRNSKHMWTPIELVEFTKNRQVCVDKPGQQMYYSDTGYILLGMIVEEVSGLPLHEQLHKTIFNPLQMTRSYMPFRSEPMAPNKLSIPPTWLNGNDISQNNVLSADWSGGGIISTTDDLLTFFKALNSGKLVSQSVLRRMTTFDKTYLKGVYYSEGMMQFKFADFNKMLADMPSLYGGVGATGTFMLYDSINDTYIIANFASVSEMDNHVMTLISALNTLSRIKD